MCLEDLEKGEGNGPQTCSQFAPSLMTREFPTEYISWVSKRGYQGGYRARERPGTSGNGELGPGNAVGRAGRATGGQGNGRGSRRRRSENDEPLVTRKALGLAWAGALGHGLAKATALAAHPLEPKGQGLGLGRPRATALAGPLNPAELRGVGRRVLWEGASNYEMAFLKARSRYS